MLDDWGFTNNNLKKALKLSIDEQITHKALVDWSFRYSNEIYINDIKNNPLDEQATKVILEIDDQWEMYITNSFNHTELQEINLETLKMPIEWLYGWYNSI